MLDENSIRRHSRMEYWVFARHYFGVFRAHFLGDLLSNFSVRSHYTNMNTHCIRRRKKHLFSCRHGSLAMTGIHQYYYSMHMDAVTITYKNMV